MLTCAKRKSNKSDTSFSQVSHLHALEEDILKLSGLQIPEELQIVDIPITFQDESYLIHTYICGSHNKESIVLVHGYGGNGLLFHRILKDLCVKYRVYCFDMLGMGLSSRPEFKSTNTLETIEYFVESMEKWRESVGLPHFYLGGHSFGGYISAQYALKYPERVKKLFLISCAGMTKPEADINTSKYAESLPWVRRKFFLQVMKIWDSGVTPGEFYKKHSIIGWMMLRNYIHRQFGSDGKDKKLADDLLKFYTDMLGLKPGSDKALFYILKPPRAMADMPLEDDLMNRLHVPMVCYFGDRDWVDQEGAHRILKQGKNDFKVKIIENAGHQIAMHNPKKLCEDIIMEMESGELVVAATVAAESK